MLRACHDVLEPGGRIGGYTIHARAGLSPDEEALAVELGPSQVIASDTPEGLLVSAGFVDVEALDVTDTFLETCQAIHRARGEREAELRREEGDEAYGQEQEKKRKMVVGIERGLLRRSLIVARKL